MSKKTSVVGVRISDEILKKFNEVLERCRAFNSISECLRQVITKMSRMSEEELEDFIYS